MCVCVRLYNAPCNACWYNKEHWIFIMVLDRPSVPFSIILSFKNIIKFFIILPNNYTASGFRTFSQGSFRYPRGLDSIGVMIR